MTSMVSRNIHPSTCCVDFILMEYDITTYSQVFEFEMSKNFEIDLASIIHNQEGLLRNVLMILKLYKFKRHHC